MKIVIFGTGKYWNNRKKCIVGGCEIVCFLDNDSSKWHDKINGIDIIAPKDVTSYQYDYVAILCASQNEIREQLHKIGVSYEKIIDYNQLRQICLHDFCIKYGEDNCKNYNVVILTTSMNYNGGTMAIIYAAKVLQNRGKNVLVCSENCDEKLLKELLVQNIVVMVIPSLPNTINDKLMSYIEDCEIVVVNVFQMLPVVCKLNGKKPVFWWIHEPKELYKPILEEFSEYNNKALYDSVNIIAVSRIAQNNFNKNFHNLIKKTLPYSIPDMLIKHEIMPKSNRIITFALIGAIIERKAQDIFINAIKQLTNDEMDKSRFYIIGSYGKDTYASKIIEESKSYSNIIITGNLTREEIDNIYTQIDVVVCPSREETMSIVLTEAMMYGKPCIGSDNTGMADYIQNGVNGFVCRTGDAYDLCDKIRYFIHNSDDIEKMGVEGRKVYEKYFTMDKFADRLFDTIQDTISLFNDKMNL